MNKCLIAQLCAMTFQGNAKNGLQQDAFFFVDSEHWQTIDKITNLQEWLNQLKKQIYQSDGKAYDNATAILIKFLDK